MSALIYIENIHTDIPVVEDEIKRLKSFVNNNGFHNGTAINQIVRRYRRELKHHLLIMQDDLKDEQKAKADEAPKKGPFDDIIEILSGIKYRDERWIKAMSWCEAKRYAPAQATELFNEVSKGKERPAKSKRNIKNKWHIPTLKEMEALTIHPDYPKNRTVWIWDRHNGENMTFGVNTRISSSVNALIPYEKYFTTLVKTVGKEIKIQTFGLMSFEDAKKLAAVSNARVPNSTPTKKVKKGSGVRRSTPKVSNTKWKINMKYVNFHYAFGGMKNAPIDSRNFAIRGYIAASAINPVGIKIKDFEFNDVGIINARFYVDSEIRSLGLDIPLHFTYGDDYEFIAKYGPRMWIKMTNYKSGFDYTTAADDIINRYFDVADKHIIKESYTKRIVIDNKPMVHRKELDDNLLTLSKFK